jgi:hypothetical protein
VAEETTRQVLPTATGFAASQPNSSWVPSTGALQVVSRAFSTSEASPPICASSSVKAVMGYC